MTVGKDVYNATNGSNRLPALASQICTEHDAALAAATSATEHAIKCGVLLIEAKAGLEHGQWLPWVQENCPFSERTAQAYMRLADKISGFDEQEAQRVADLPVREAVKAIADSRDDQITEPLPPLSDEGTITNEAWAWADRQIHGPFNEFDFRNLTCLQNKLMSQTGVPDAVHIAIGIEECRKAKKNYPVPSFLPEMPYDLLIEAIKCLAPAANGNISGLDICFDDGFSQDPIGNTVALQLTACRAAGSLFNELKRRDKNGAAI